MNFKIGTIYKTKDEEMLFECFSINKKDVIMIDILHPESGFYYFDLDGKWPDSLNDSWSILRVATQEEINEKYMLFGMKTANQNR